jgi:protease PrsW
MIVFGLAVLPCLLVCFLVFRLDKYDQEPIAPLIVAFVLGGCMTYPVVSIEKWLFSAIATNPGVGELFLLTFVGIAFMEELAKYLCLRLAAYPFAFFNEPMDGIVYAVMVSMGFAAMENLAYADRFGYETLFMRAFTSVPAHLCFAIVMGYFVGKAKFSPEKVQTDLLEKGFYGSVILHGIYDFLIMQKWFDWLVVLGASGLYICLFMVYPLLQEHVDNSPFRSKLDSKLDNNGTADDADLTD